jgi:hypothetical protein
MTQVLPDDLAPQAEQVLWWHAYALIDPEADRSEDTPQVLVEGPQGFREEHAKTLGGVFTPRRQHVGSWDHEPTEGELAELVLP